MTAIDKLLVAPRSILVLVMIFHGIGKFAAPLTFADKFDIPIWLGVLAGLAEVLAALGFATGLALNGKFGTTVTWLAGIALAAVQIPAIIIVHSGGFFYFQGGVEYNLVLLVMAGTIMAGALVSYQQKHGAYHGRSTKSTHNSLSL